MKHILTSVLQALHWTIWKETTVFTLNAIGLLKHFRLLVDDLKAGFAIGRKSASAGAHDLQEDC